MLVSGLVSLVAHMTIAISNPGQLERCCPLLHDGAVFSGWTPEIKSSETCFDSRVPLGLVRMPTAGCRCMLIAVCAFLSSKFHPAGLVCMTFQRTAVFAKKT